MNINSAFVGDYLRADDFAEGETRMYTIKNVSREKVGDDEKPVVHFLEVTQGLVLNKTNATTLAALYGPETDAWEGQKIVLYAAWVDFAGKQVKGVRLKKPAPNAVAPPPGVSKPPSMRPVAPPPAAGPPDMAEKWSVWDGTQEITMSRAEILDAVKANASFLLCLARKTAADTWTTVEAAGLSVPF